MIISQNDINQWAFVIETLCVFWEVGADCLNSIKKLESNAQNYAGRSLGAGRAIRVGQVFSEEPDIKVGDLGVELKSSPPKNSIVSETRQRGGHGPKTDRSTVGDKD